MEVHFSQLISYCLSIFSIILSTSTYSLLFILRVRSILLKIDIIFFIDIWYHIVYWHIFLAIIGLRSSLLKISIIFLDTKY